MLKLVPFDFIKPSKLLYGLSPWDYLALDADGNLLARGTNKIVVLDTPGIFGYFNLREAYPLGNYPNTNAKAIDDTPAFDEKPWGSLGEVQAIPGYDLVEPVQLDQKTFDAVIKGIPNPGGNPTVAIQTKRRSPGLADELEKFIEDGPRRMDAAAAEVMKSMKRDPLDHDGDGKKGGSLKGTRKRKAK